MTWKILSGARFCGDSTLCPGRQRRARRLPPAGRLLGARCSGSGPAPLPPSPASAPVAARPALPGEGVAHLPPGEVVLHQRAHDLLGGLGGAQVGCDGVAQHPLRVPHPAWGETAASQLLPSFPPTPGAAGPRGPVPTRGKANTPSSDLTGNMDRTVPEAATSQRLGTRGPGACTPDCRARQGASCESQAKGQGGRDDWPTQREKALRAATRRPPGCAAALPGNRSRSEGRPAAPARWALTATQPAWTAPAAPLGGTVGAAGQPHRHWGASLGRGHHVSLRPYGRRRGRRSTAWESLLQSEPDTRRRPHPNWSPSRRAWAGRPRGPGQTVGFLLLVLAVGGNYLRR